MVDATLYRALAKCVGVMSLGPGERCPACRMIGRCAPGCQWTAAVNEAVTALANATPTEPPPPDDVQPEERKRLAQALLDSSEKPEPGDLYEHHRFGKCICVCIAIREVTLVPVVVFQLLSTGHMWERTLDNWNEIVNGLPRFKHMKATWPGARIVR